MKNQRETIGTEEKLDVKANFNKANKQLTYTVMLDSLVEVPIKFVTMQIELKKVLSQEIKFYICSSVHHNSRLKKSNKMQLYVDIYLLLNYSTCFGHPSHPPSGVQKTVVAASGTSLLPR